MPRTPALLIGVGTALPLAYVAYMVVRSFRGMFEPGSAVSYEELAQSQHVLVLVLTVLIAFYIAHLFTNRAVTGRAAWIAAFLVFGPLAELRYWWLHIWSSRSDDHVNV